MDRISCIWKVETNGYNVYSLDGRWLTLFIPSSFEPDDEEVGEEEPCEWDGEIVYRWDNGIETVTYRE